MLCVRNKNAKQATHIASDFDLSILDVLCGLNRGFKKGAPTPRNLGFGVQGLGIGALGVGGWGLV